MGLPTLYNAKTTNIDLSACVFADDADTNPVATPGTCTASSVSLYQSGDAVNESSRTWALIPVKIDVSNADTFEFSFKYNKGAYVPTNVYEAMELGFILNAGNLANFNPVDWQLHGYDVGVGGILIPAFNFQVGTNEQWQMFADVPPRTEKPSGDVLLDGSQTFGADSGNAWLSANAYAGVSTITCRARFKKAVAPAGWSVAGQTITALLMSLAENGNVVTLPATENFGDNGVFALYDANISGSSADPLASPYLPLTLTPFVRRFSYHDTGSNPMTLSDLSVTVGSSVKPVFWTDLLGCVES